MASSAANGSPRRLVLPAGVLGLLAVMVRLPALHQPLDRDTAAHAAIGAYLSDGLLPYVDVIDNKQPLPYLLFAGVSLVREHSTALVRVAAAIVAAAAVVAVVVLGARVLGRTRATLAGAVVALAGASRWVQGADLNTEHLLVLTGSLAVLVPLAVPSTRRWWPLACGALGGLAALTKAPGALLAVAALVPLLVTRDDRGQSAWATVWRYGVGAAVPAALLALPWAATGHLGALVRWNVTYNLAYGAAAPDRPWWRAVFPTPDLWPVTLLMATAAAVVVWRLVRGDRDTPVVTVGLWLLATYVGAKAGQRDFHHYYAPMVVPAALGLAMAPVPRRLPGRAAIAAAGLAVVAPFAVDLASTVGRDPVALSERVYGPDAAAVWAQHHAVGDLLARRAEPGDRVFVVGSEPGFYWASGLRPASPQLLDFARDVVGPEDYDAEVGDAVTDPGPPRFVVQPYDGIAWPPTPPPWPTCPTSRSRPTAPSPSSSWPRTPPSGEAHLTAWGYVVAPRPRCPMASTEKLVKRAHKARIPSMQRHVLVCTDSDCGGKTVAKAMRKEVARLGLRAEVTVTKVDCLDICKGGTIAVVYPEGTWYHGLDEDTAREVVARHLADGDVLHDHVFVRNALCPVAERPGT